MRTVKQLQSKKGRDEQGLFIVEGEKFVNEIPGEYAVRRYIMAERFAAGRDLTAYECRARCEIVPDAQFDAAADTVTPQGILAICEQKQWTLADLHKPNGFLLMGEQLSDPGNIGTLIRTAAAAGAQGVILTHQSGEIYNPKVLRAAAGAVLRLPIVSGVNAGDTITWLQQSDYIVVGAHPQGEMLPYDVNMQCNVCILVGNESHGLTDEAALLADICVHLPMQGGIESLNASIAGGVLMYEVVRQRMGF